MRTWKKRAGGEFLVQLVRTTVKLGDKCEHNRGRWIVAEKDGSAFYCLDPQTQLQKDIWLGSSRQPGAGDKDERISALRWQCFECGTVQAP